MFVIFPNRLKVKIGILAPMNLSKRAVVMISESVIIKLLRYIDFD
jgi:hypothetical protein